MLICDNKILCKKGVAFSMFYVFNRCACLYHIKKKKKGEGTGKCI